MIIGKLNSITGVITKLKIKDVPILASLKAERLASEGNCVTTGKGATQPRRQRKTKVTA